VRAPPPGAPRARHSAVFFCNLGYDALVAPVGGRGAPVVAGRYLMAKLGLMFDGWQQELQGGGGEEEEAGQTRNHG
jgi:hypothetical protein